MGVDGHATSGPRSPAGTPVRVGKVLGVPLGYGLKMDAEFLGVPDDLAYEVGPLFGQDVASRSCGQQLLGLLRREPLRVGGRAGEARHRNVLGEQLYPVPRRLATLMS